MNQVFSLSKKEGKKEGGAHTRKKEERSHTHAHAKKERI